MGERLPPISAAELHGDRRALQDYLVEQGEAVFGPSGQPFIWQRPDDGALVGPYRIFLELPRAVSEHFFGLVVALGQVEGLPRHAREVAIISTGQLFQSPYELCVSSSAASVAQC
jgi:hypothetical protein